MARPHLKLPILTQQEIEAFWNLVDKTPGQGPNGECHEWKGGRHPDGYGKYNRLARFLSHRVAYFLLRGEDPGKLDVCHHCDNPPCCRDEHLFPGTNADNMADARQKDRFARGENHWFRTRPETVASGEHHGSRTQPESRARGQSHGSRTHPERLVRGEKVKGATLKQAQVLELRSLATGRRGEISFFASKYEVAPSTIWRALHRETWKHI